MQHRGLGSRFGVSIEIDHIVEITRPGAIAEGTDLLGESFLVGVAEDSDSFRRRVAVVVKDDALYRPQHEKLVRCQVELDARKTTRARRNRPPIADLALAGHRAARVFEDLEFLELCWNLDAGPFVDPLSYFAEDAGEEVTIDM